MKVEKLNWIFIKKKKKEKKKKREREFWGIFIFF